MKYKKMLRISLRTVSMWNNAIKSVPAILEDTKDYRAFVRLPNILVSRGFCTKDVKQHVSEVKSPLTTLIANEALTKIEPEKQESEDAKKSKEQSWRRMKYTLIIFGASFTCIGVYLITELGKPRIDKDGSPIIDQFSGMPWWKQYILRTFGELNYYGQLLKEPSREKLLPDIINHPMYHPQYTLILEFTDIIVHPDWTYNTGWRFKKRPGLDHFLESLNGIYEIVIYTAEQGMTVFPIIEAVDPRNLINYKLVRDATLFVDGTHVKDLDKLNRNLNKVIVVDWDPKSTKYHPDNVLTIPRWKGNDDDVTLLHLSSFLLAISQTEIDDVREVVRYYNQFEDPLATFREKQKKLIERAEEEAAEERSKNSIAQTSVVRRWTPQFLRRSF